MRSRPIFDAVSRLVPPIVTSRTPSRSRRGGSAQRCCGPSIRDIANAILADQSGANHGEAAQGQHSPRNDAAHRKSARFNTISQQAETILPGSTALTSSLR